MLTHISAISSLLLGIAFFLVGNGLLNTLLQLRGLQENYSTLVIGFFMSAYYAGYFIGSWVDSRIIRRIGHIRSFALFASVTAVAALLHILIIHPWVWIILRFFYGIALIGIYMIIESWLNSQTPSSHRGQVFAIYMIINFLSMAVGQQFLRIDESLGFLLFAIVAITINLSLAPIMLTRRMQPVLPEKQTSNLYTLFKKAPLPLVASCLSGLNAGAFWGMAPAYASMINFNTQEVATLITAAIVGGALLQYPIGRLSDRHDRRKVLLCVSTAATLFALLIALPLPREWHPWLFCLWGGLSFTIYSLAVAQLIDQLAAEEILSGSASLLLVNAIGATFAPTLAGAFIKLIGPIALPLMFVGVTGILALYTLYRVIYKSVKITEPFAQFVPMVRTSTTALELMPEAEAASAASAANENHSGPATQAAQEENPLPTSADTTASVQPSENKTEAPSAPVPADPVAPSGEPEPQSPEKDNHQ